MVLVTRSRHLRPPGTKRTSLRPLCSAVPRADVTNVAVDLRAAIEIRTTATVERGGMLKCSLMGTGYTDALYARSKMPWDEFILEQFASVPPGIAAQTDESHLYGPYNTLLFHLFPPHEHFMVSPQWHNVQDKRSIDFTTLFVVERKRHPVFFLQVEPAGDYGAASSCEIASRFFAMFSRYRLSTVSVRWALASRCTPTMPTRGGCSPPQFCKT